MNLDKLVIRRFESEDWQDLFDYLSDEQVIKFEPYDAFTEKQCKQEASNRAVDPNFWAVCLESSNKVIGNIYFADKGFFTWELGYVFNSAYHGQGYATKACKLVIQKAIDTCDVHRIGAMCDPDNISSWKLLERLGMRREAHKIQNVFLRPMKIMSQYGRTLLNTPF